MAYYSVKERDNKVIYSHQQTSAWFLGRYGQLGSNF